MFGRFSLKQIQDLPTISEGHTDDLKFDDGTTRVWLSRLTVEDGAELDNEVTVERSIGGRMEPIDVYQATDWTDYTDDHPYFTKK